MSAKLVSEHLKDLLNLAKDHEDGVVMEILTDVDELIGCLDHMINFSINNSLEVAIRDFYHAMKWQGAPLAAKSQNCQQDFDDALLRLNQLSEILSE